MTGTDEGGFAWLTLNYLLGHLGQSNSNTVAAIDLVGALGCKMVPWHMSVTCLPSLDGTHPLLHRVADRCRWRMP